MGSFPFFPTQCRPELRCAIQTIGTSTVKAPWNPSSSEIREWAFDPESLAPCEDWDLALSWAQDERVYLDLASDDSCPKRRFFLSLIYLMVGDAVRSDFNVRPRPIIEGFIALGDEYRHHDIQLWQRRSRLLLLNPDSFDYADWCGGRLAAS